MLQLIAWIAGGLVVVLAAVGLTFFVGLREKSPTVRRLVRGFARKAVNPRMMKTAGTPGAYASVIHHVGRMTGRRYRTPVVAAPTDDGFAIALPYGTTSNWVKNVMASGSATILYEGVIHQLDRPRIVPLTLMADRFPPKDQRSHERFKVDQCLHLHRADPVGVARGEMSMSTR